MSAVTLLNTIYRRNIKSAGTLRHAYTFSTSCYQRLTLESWFTNLEQTPLNRCQQLPAAYKRYIQLTDSCRTYDDGMNGQPAI